MRITPKNEFDPQFLETLPYDSPFFLFSKKKILDNYKAFKKLFPRSSIYYAMKANSEQGVLKILADAGSGFEVASRYELNMLKEIKVPAEKIIYGTSVKPASHVKEFFDYGVDRFAFDSFPELEKIAAMAPSSKVYARTIANDSGSVFKFSEKFGTDPTSIIPLLLRAKELGLHPYGISFHVGSQASDKEAWASVLGILRSIIQDLKEMGIKLDVINLGGGYPCKYASSENIPSLQEIAEHSIKQYKKLPYRPKLILEPGRGIIADTGIAVASVIARIERRGSTWLFLDLGVYSGLFETMAYQGSTRYPVSSMRKVGDSGESLFELAGPTGDSPDVITREALLPMDIDVGDKLIFHNVGAYSIGMTNPFNGFPKPDVYFI
jgi:ornithine decarboxylase